MEEKQKKNRASYCQETHFQSALMTLRSVSMVKGQHGDLKQTPPEAQGGAMSPAVAAGEIFMLLVDPVARSLEPDP